MKKLSTFLCMVLCSIALHANVVSGTCGDNLTWSYDTETQALTIEGTGDMYDYYYDAAPWAQVNSSILSVSLPDGLTRIGSSAFVHCSSITSITIPNSVTSIGERAFDWCDAITKTNYTGDIASWCAIQFSTEGSNPIHKSHNFYINDVEITNLVIPNGVTSIGEHAFLRCLGITSVTIPNSVTSIGNSAFYDCYNLTSVTLGNSVTSIGVEAFMYCSALISVTIPNSVTSIGRDAFSSCSQVIVECTTPPSIESGTFKSDATIYVPCFTVGIYLAAPVWQFLSIVADDNYRINLSATEGGEANLTATDCDANTATIEATSDNCSHFVQWSDGITDNPRIVNLTQDTTLVAQFESRTYQVNIYARENGLLRVGSDWYYWDTDTFSIEMTDCGNELTTNQICAVPDEGYYFTGWSDGNSDQCRDIYITSDTTIVAHFAEKQQVQVLVGVESACKNMGTVSGSGIYYQGDVVTITATPNSGYHFVEWSDGNSIANREIYVLSDTILFATFAAGDMGGKCGENLYWTWEDGALTITGTGEMDLKNHPAWLQYESLQITSVNMPEGMTSISADAFYRKSISTILVPASVEIVGNRAFANNYRLTHFEYLGNNIQWEGQYYYDEYDIPLYRCSNLQYFRGNIQMLQTFPDSVIVSNGYASEDMNKVYVDNTNAYDYRIGGNFDEGVKTIQTLYLPAGLVEIGDYTLQNARFLGGITIPEGVTRIGISAFEDCRSMDSIVFAGNNVQEIGAWAFYNCHNLSRITIPEGVEEIGTAAFYGCTFLSELTLPSTTKKIAQNGFALCSKLQTMYVNALVPPTIEAKTFEDVDRATPVFVPRGTIGLYQADTYWSEFFNMAEYDAPSGNLNISADEANGLRKVVRDGQVLILRGDKTYTVLGEAL